MKYDEILAKMLEEIPSEFDNTPGSFFYDLLAPVAMKFEELYERNETLKSNVDISLATGEYLDRRVAEQGITRRAATNSKGILRITGRKGEVILKGSKAANADLLFSVGETVTIPESGEVEVTASCITPGEDGNVGAGEINRFPITLPGVTSVTNPYAFDGGYDAESDAELYDRYMEKVSRPTAGSTMYAYIEWAKEANTGVGDVQVIPTWNGPGTVKVIIADKIKGEASDELVQTVHDYIETRRPIGVEVTVESAVVSDINISVTVRGRADIESELRAAVEKYLGEIAAERKYVSYAYIGKLVMMIDGVEDYYDLIVNGGAENIELAQGYVPTVNAVEVTEYVPPVVVTE